MKLSTITFHEHTKPSNDPRNDPNGWARKNIVIGTITATPMLLARWMR